jgi:hypothetical protein
MSVSSQQLPALVLAKGNGELTEHIAPLQHIISIGA